jgi:signal transduction histidine kinase
MHPAPAPSRNGDTPPGFPAPEPHDPATVHHQREINERKRIDASLRATLRAVVHDESEITERKRIDAALRATLECGEAMIRATSEPELLEAICASIVRMGSYRMAWVGFPQMDRGKRMIPVARAGAGQDYVDKARITWAPGVPRGSGPVGLAMRTRRPVAWRNLAHDPRFAPWRREAVRRGYASVISLPLLWRSECLGTLSIYSDQAAAFQREEAQLLENLAADIAYGLTALRTRAEHERLQRELLEVSEREQRRIAQDLHDGLCQQLLGASYLAGAMHRRLAQRNDPEAPALRRIAETLTASAVDARSLAHGVHPVGSSPRALMGALRDFAAVTSRMFAVQCHFHCSRPVLLSHQSTASHLYRIAQEAVGNAIKHGAPTRITIRLGKAPLLPGDRRRRVTLTIRDNGTGFPAHSSSSTDPAKPAKPGMGLQIMRHRASICDGTLAIRKSPPHGTFVTCNFPVTSGKA